MTPNIGISAKNLEGSAVVLANILADEMILYIKTRKAHWNVAGESFMEFHKLFESQYKQLEESIDEVAERIGKLGHKAIGTMDEFLKITSIKERPGEYLSASDLLKELLKDHQTIIISLRKAAEASIEKNIDAGTADFLTALMEQHETTAWVLRRYLS
jgi:starvation-inducible DNA-binding protein